MPNISTDPIVPSDPASVRLNPFKYIALLIGLYGAYTQIAKHYGSKKADINVLQLEDSRSNFRFQLRTSVLLGTLVASSTWFFGFSGIVATFAFVVSIVSVEFFRAIRRRLGNKFLAELEFEPMGKMILSKTARKERLSAEEIKYVTELNDIQRIGWEDADSWSKYFEHFFDPRTWPILGSRQQIRSYYAAWALYPQKNSAHVSVKAEGKEEEKFCYNDNYNTPFDVSMLADGKLIEDDVVANFAVLMGISVKFYSNRKPSTFARVGSYRENCSFHCLIHCIFSQKDEYLKSMFEKKPLYLMMLDEFYQYYDLRKNEDQNDNINNFIALIRWYSHPTDREIFLGQFFREFLRNLKEGNQFPTLNVGITDSFAIQYFSKQEKEEKEEEKIALSIYHTEDGGGHFYFSYGSELLDSEHNKKLSTKSRLRDATEITGVDRQTACVKRFVQEDYNDLVGYRQLKHNLRA